MPSLVKRPVLVTGFEPFGGQSINPSAQVARGLHGRDIAGARVTSLVLPVVFGEAAKQLVRAIRVIRPELVVCLGEAGGRDDITIERVAINVNDARIADNQGAQPIDLPVVARAPAAYWSTLPIKAIVEALESRNIPASVSNTAGTFVCNHVFFKLMHELASHRRVRGGFVHLPFLPEQVAGLRWETPSLPLETQVRAIEVAIESSRTTRRDRRLSGGKTQ